VRSARWREFDLTERVWTIPGERMKAGREHRVPLTDAALAILTAMRTMLGGKLGPDGEPDPGRLIFPASHGGTLSDTVATMALRRTAWTDAAGEPVTLHGYRSTFRDWAAAATGHSDAVAEAALAHAVGDKVVAAYQRGDLFEKRRGLMEDWANYLTEPRPQVVRPRFGQKRSAHAVAA
jgi:integrase